jgi:uncharacterized protein
MIRFMELQFELNGMTFVWDSRKAAANPGKHDGITFEQAATVFFDPFFRLADAGRNDEVRNAVIGIDITGLVLISPAACCT